MIKDIKSHLAMQNFFMIKSQLVFTYTKVAVLINFKV